MASVLFVVIVGLVIRNQIKVSRNRQAARERAAQAIARAQAIPQELFDLLRPVGLSKCELVRFGEANDGGYVLCGNLLSDARAGYSYGINGYDQWGCDVSMQLKVPVHQYDCFNTEVPMCRKGRTVFHAECVGASSKTEEGRLFDTIAAQLNRNGDATNHVVIKMDVEGAEWESLLTAPDELLERIDQLAVEFHGVKAENYLDVVRRLKRYFHVAHFHVNNFSCQDGLGPFPGWAYEVLFVSRRLDSEDPSRLVAGPLPIDAVNNPAAGDCQATHGGR